MNNRTDVRRVFLEVADLPHADQAAALDRACAGNEPLRAEVDALLAADRDADRFMTRPTELVRRIPAMAPRRETAGTRLGLYTLVELIGEGGFGSVFLAEQEKPIARKVALKIVKPGMDSKQVVGRFEAERQALAMMDHPNIARVYDAGTTPTGRPYFVMELVRGEPITQYCDASNLTTRERLELFVSICHAVQHAHVKGIVHRDIKPSNVLVTLHDGIPVVKVIDFGIAKAMNQELTDQTVFTEFRQFVGTPEYMSPEQAAMSGLDVDSRTDIYSLGVLLYELISGSTPFDAQVLRSAGLAEIQRIIREDEPPKPSTRVSRGTTGTGASKGDAETSSTSDAPEPSRPGLPATGKRSGTLAEIARHRRTDPRSLKRLLSGDLDWIVMKAMEKDRTRRYDTAAALAEDIGRHLRYEPILACPPSATYRLRKFARRNRVGVGAAGGVIFATLLTLAALGYGLMQAQSERDRTLERETETRAKMLLSSMNAVRTYTSDNVRTALAVAASGNIEAKVPDYNAHFMKEMVPGFSARQVFANFRDAKRPDGSPGPYSTFVYKEAAGNPTNRENLADDFEKKLIERFVSDPSLAELSDTTQRGGARAYYIARPMVIKDAKCLDCHTTAETAPPGQIAQYGREGGYGWKMGEVVAAQVVYVPVSEGFGAGKDLAVKVMVGLAGFCLAGGLVSLLLLTRRG